MKTSNILFTALLGLGFLIITAFSIEMSTWEKFSGVTTKTQLPQAPLAKVELPEFSHIKVKDMQSLILTSSTSAPGLEKLSGSDSSAHFPDYTVSGDTLIIDPNKSSTRNIEYRLLCSENLKSITADNSELILFSLRADSLSFLVNTTLINLQDLGVGNEYEKISIEANAKSEINWHGGDIKNLTIEFNSSKGTFHGRTDNVEAFLNSSGLLLSEATKLQIEKQGRSRLEILQ